VRLLLNFSANNQLSKRKEIMPELKTVAEKAPNYTEAMVQQIRDAAPLNFESATALGEVMGKSPRSIIAKAKREGVEYLAKVPEPKKGKDAPTKGEIADTMRNVTGLNMHHIEKASVACLQELSNWIAGVLPEQSEQAEDNDS